MSFSTTSAQRAAARAAELAAEEGEIAGAAELPAVGPLLHAAEDGGHFGPLERAELSLAGSPTDVPATGLADPIAGGQLGTSAPVLPPRAAPVDPVLGVDRPPPDVLPPPQMHFELPDNLGRAPNMDDLIVVRGFDGRTPDEARAAVLSAALAPVARENEAFLAKTIDDTLKRFSVAVNNAFIPGPTTEFLDRFPGGKVSIIGDLSWTKPVVYEVNYRRQPTQYFARDRSGEFVPVDPPRTPVVRTPLQRTPPGVQVEYLPWRSDALSGKTGFVDEL